MNGFSLTELLVVIAIGGILAYLAVPTVVSISSEESVNGAVSGISLLLNQARAYAMSHSTYVWVGFYPNQTSQQLSVGAVAGVTGEVGDLSSISTYTPIMKMQTYNYMSLKQLSGLAGMSTNENDITTSQVGTFQQTQGANIVTFSMVLQFSPQGEASVDASSGISHWIQIGLQPVKGGNTNSLNVAVFQVAALTGEVQIFRP